MPVLPFPRDSYARAEEARQARADALCASRERWAQELEIAVLAGMTGGASVRLPYVRRGVTHHRDTIVSQSLVEAVHETLEYDEVLGQLLHLLQHSPCPEVAALRRAIAARYARTWAEELADLDLREA